MTSHEPGQCCFVAYKHEGEARGSVDKLGGINAYIARPEGSSTEHGIILFPDFMGYELINTKLYDPRRTYGNTAANTFLQCGRSAGQKRNEKSTFPLSPWFRKHGPDRVVPIAEAVVRAIRDEHGAKKLGGVGYCLGAKYVCQFMAEGKGVDAGFFAHPTAVTPEEVKGVTAPLSIAAAETDHMFPPPKTHETEGILKGMNISYQLSLYSGVEHGFALKAYLSKPSVKFAAETAFLQAVNWFDHYLKAT